MLLCNNNYGGDKMSEELIAFSSFNHSDALNFGLRVIEIAKKEKLKPLRIRVTIDADIVFQYLMDGKTNDLWLNRKENTVLKTRQSSMYVFNNPDLYKNIVDDVNYAICGGGYPLIVADEFKGVFCISGLQHYEDHALIVRVLNEMKDKQKI